MQKRIKGIAKVIRDQLLFYSILQKSTEDI